MRNVFPLILVISLLVLNGCVKTKETPIEKITLNVCQTDQENADYWSKTKVNLFDKPGGISMGAKKIGEIPSCSSISLDILEKRLVDRLVFYRVRYEDTIGWQTKRLLVGEQLTSEYREEPKLEQKEEKLSDQRIIDSRKNYEVVVKDWLSIGWGRHYNPNVDRDTDSYWTKLEVLIKNNNPDIKLNYLTVRVNIKHPAGSDGKTISGGRLAIDVSDIGYGESKQKTVYYPGDLSSVTTMENVYTTIEKDINQKDYGFFKELQ